MHLKERPAATMKLVGGRLCLDFVNTVGGRKYEASGRKSVADTLVIRDDKLNDYADLLAWSQHTGVLTETEVRGLLRAAEQHELQAAKVFMRARKLREAIYHLCRVVIHNSPPPKEDLELLNAELTQAQKHERLAFSGGQFVWQWGEDRQALDRMLWPIVWSAAELLSTGDLKRLRECGGEDCGWLFEDTSRNRSRQWCVMEDCGNLAKVRRFRARQQVR